MNLPDVSAIRQLVSLVEANELEEITVEDGSACITVRRACERLFAPVGSSGTCAAPLAEPPPPQAPEARNNLVHVTAPIVGVFYRAPDPSADPYVEIGSVVEEGMTVGLVEAMKVFNEIVAEVRGRVVEIPADNEQLVNRGETLVVIDPLG